MNNNLDYLKNIPSELKELRCWVGYKLEIKDGGKTKKIPKNPNTGGNAMPNNPNTWGSYNDALNSVIKFGFDGIGFMFTKENGYIGIDVDNCLEYNGIINDLGKEAIDLINSYTEKSLSGLGIHIICKGYITNSKKDDTLGLEIYDSARYFVMTGNVMYNKKIIEKRDNELNEFYSKYFPERPNIYEGKSNSNSKQAVDENYNSPEKILNAAFNSCNGNKIKSLYSGDLNYHNGDHSSADLSLSNYLAFFSNKDPKIMDEIFRRSGLYREKWDEIHYSNGATYGDKIIENAINSCNSNYYPDNYYKERQNRIPEWYELNPRTGNIRINTGLLTKHIISLYPAINIFDNFYIYDEGCYKLINKNKRYAIIKKFIDDKYITSNMLKDVEFQWVNDINVQSNMDELNQYPFIINLKNGLFDIKKRQLMSHTKNYISTVQLNVLYDENKKCPMFLDYINQSVDESTVNLIQELLGYLLVPITVTQKSFIIVGPSNTGKSTLLKVMKSIIGDNNISNIPMQCLNDRFKTAELNNKLVNICADLPTKPLEDTAIFKMLTGEDMISAEKKFGDPFSFYNVARLVFSCNTLPSTMDKSDAYYNRLVIIPFNNRVKHINPFLSQDLEKEKDGIFMWSLEGLYRLLNNNFKFSESKVTDEMLNRYRIEQSNIQYFISEKCIIGEDKFVGSQQLYDSYKKFCLANNLKPLTQQKFSSEITNLNIPIRKTQIGIDRKRSYTGIGLIF